MANQQQWCAEVTHQRTAMVTGVAGLAVVLVWGIITTGNAGFRQADQQILVGINSVHNTVFDLLGRAFELVFAPKGAIVVVVLIAALTGVMSRSVRDGLFVGVAIGVTYLGLYVVKVLVSRPRPDALPYAVPGILAEQGKSFPSGHTGIAAAIVVILVLAAPRVAAKVTIAIGGGLVVVATALSRLYVGAHFPDDVTASVVYACTVGPAVYVVLWWIDARIPGRSKGSKGDVALQGFGKGNVRQ